MTPQWPCVFVSIVMMVVVQEVTCEQPNDQQTYVDKIKQADNQHYHEKIARCNDQISGLINGNRLCRNLTYFYSPDCMTMRASDLDYMIAKRRASGWNMAVERIPIKMEWTGTFLGTTQVRGHPPVAQTGWICAQVHDESAWNYMSACYVSSGACERSIRLGIYAASVPNSGLLAWIHPTACPHEISLLRFDLASTS